jgi:hypothetical protein
MDEQREEQQESHLPSVWHLTRQQVALASGTMLAATGVDLLAHLGPTGLVVGGILAFAAARHGQGLHRQVQALLSPAPPRRSHLVKRGNERSVLDRALGRFPDTLAAAEDQEPLFLKEERTDHLVAEEDLLHQRQQAPQAGVSLSRRLTIDEIVRHVEPNSYRIYIGRSLTRPGSPAILISFYQQHVKLIGASQRGKSSMAAAFLEIVIRTHDTDHVLVALLDLEDRTSHLFAKIDHLAEVCVNGEWVPLHARSHEQVLEYLGFVLEIVRMRYALSHTDLLHQPLVLVYLEEFIELKDYFKTRMDIAPDEEKAQARRDYAALVYRIKTIARMGLKVRVQFLLCAQVDYRDEDLQEALINVTAGMSFSVRVSAAQAAGFYHTALLQRNAQEDRVGQAVVQMPECKDLVLVPEYPLEHKLLALEEAEREQGRALPRQEHHRLRPAGQRRNEPPSPFPPVAQTRQRPAAEVAQVLPFDQPARKQPTQLERGIAVYQHGAITQPKLAAALGISAWEARNLMPKIEAEIARREASKK